LCGPWKKFASILAKGIAQDGEGASRLIACTVRGAESEAVAEGLAKAVVGSSLVKAACFGADANWGRILCAMGYSGFPFNPETVAVRFASASGEVVVCRNGASVPFSEEIAKKVLSEPSIDILIDVGKSMEAKTDSPRNLSSATCWGCDLTYEYVK